MLRILHLLFKLGVGDKYLVQMSRRFEQKYLTYINLFNGFIQNKML